MRLIFRKYPFYFIFYSHVNHDRRGTLYEPTSPASIDTGKKIKQQVCADVESVNSAAPEEVCSGIINPRISR
jgi:hypothetical protein